MFARMKLVMDRYLNVKGRVIFRQSADILMQELEKLQLKVLDMVKTEVESLKGLVEDQYVPFWKKNSRVGGGGEKAEEEEERLQRKAKERVDQVIFEMEKICKKANVATDEIGDYFNESLFTQVKRKMEESDTTDGRNTEKEGEEEEKEEVVGRKWKKFKRRVFESTEEDEDEEDEDEEDEDEKDEDEEEENEEEDNEEDMAEDDYSEGLVTYEESENEDEEESENEDEEEGTEYSSQNERME